MVKIRLQRIGKRNRPHFRLVAQDSRWATRGKVLEVLGYFDPLKEGVYSVKLDRVDNWIKQGAQLTKRAKRLVDLARRQ